MTPSNSIGGDFSGPDVKQDPVLGRLDKTCHLHSVLWSPISRNCLIKPFSWKVNSLSNTTKLALVLPLNDLAAMNIFRLADGCVYAFADHTERET